MLSDIFPTGFEVGVLNGQVRPGDTVVIVGAGPVGLAALLTAQLYSPSEIIVVDMDEHRLQTASTFGATRVVNSSDGQAATAVLDLTGGVGVDVAIEAVGVPATFDLCQSIVAPGGRIANVGVHGKPVLLHLETLWSQNVTITTGLVDTELDAPPAEDGAVGQAPAGPARHPSLPAGRDDGGLRRVRERGPGEGAEGGPAELLESAVFRPPFRRSGPRRP